MPRLHRPNVVAAGISGWLLCAAMLPADEYAALTEDEFLVIAV